MDGETLPHFAYALAHDQRRFEESLLAFFSARIRNANTRESYLRALKPFFRRMSLYNLHIETMSSALIGAYIETLTFSIPSVRQHFAAIKSLFSHLHLEGVLSHNPTAAVKGPRFSQTEGKTPAFEEAEIQLLLNSIETDTLVGLRDRALLSTLFYSFSRVSAVTSLKLRDSVRLPSRSLLRFGEKGGLQHEIPCHRKLEAYLLAYLALAQLPGKDCPIFQPVRGKSQSLLGGEMSRFDVYRMVRRRTSRVGLPPHYGCHSFRATGITLFLENGGIIENAQKIAGHASPLTTKLYDRRLQKNLMTEINRLDI